MSCATESNGSTVNFSIISEEAPKISDRLVIKTDPCKAESDDPGEDDVFANENAQSLKGENTSNESYNAPSVITSGINGVKSPVVVVVSSALLPNSHTGPNNSCNAISPTHGTNNTCNAISPPPTTTPTTRRPSYTNKAPSALVNLPKTIDEIDNNNTIGGTSTSHSLQNFAINAGNGVEILDKRNIHVAEFHHGESIRSSAKELLHLHNQGSYEIDEYADDVDAAGGSAGGSNTDCDNEASTSSVNCINAVQVTKIKSESKINAELLNSGRSWEAAASSDVLTVRCREHVGELHRVKFGSGSKGKSIKFGDRWCTPIEFETLSGRASCKDWKRSIRFHGQHLQKLIEDRYLTLHAISCTCGICRGDETLNGPVKLFQSVKRKGSQLNSPHLKKKSFSGEEYKGFFKRERFGSYSVDGDVFSMAHDDGTMPPMTPLTPMTPITPHTPFGANCMTPLAVPSGNFPTTSPPKSVALQVPITTVSTNGNTMASAKGDGAVSSPAQYTLPPPSTSKIQTQADISSQQHWIQLEEMATNLVSIAHRLRLMIDQVKIQTEASKDSAVTQAKIQAESEKAEAISLVRRGQLQHIIQSSTTPISSTSETTQPQQYMVVSKICQNCGREAYLECTGCYRSYYCGQFCQQKDWLSHKLKCRELVVEDIQQQAQNITVSTPHPTSSE